MRRQRLIGLAAVVAALVAAPSAAAATLAYVPTNEQIGTYVLTPDAGGGDLLLSGGVYNDGANAYEALSFQHDGGLTEYPAFCQLDGSDRPICPVIEGDAFRYEGTEGVDELHVGLGDAVPPWLPITFNGRGGNDIVRDDYESSTVTRVFDGGDGNDTLKGFTGSDQLLGGPGNDDLEGGKGSDEVRGGDGDDKVKGDDYDEPAADIIDGGPGFDESDGWVIPGASTNPSVTVTQDGAANDGRPGEGDNVTSIEKISTSASGSYEGTDGNDDFNLYGSGESHSANLKAGDDKFDGGYGQETVDAGPGNDNIQGGYGHDTITPGPGQDIVNGDGGSYCGLFSCNVPYGNDTIHARDGEADTIECGVGQDTVVADAVDTVAPSCESVDTANTNTNPGGGGGSGLASSLTLVSKRSIRAIVRSGLSFRIPCSAPCEVKGQLVYKGVTIGKGAKTLVAPGTATVKVRITKKGKRKLRRLRKATVSLKVSVKTPAGTESFTKAIALKR